MTQDEIIRMAREAGAIKRYWGEGKEGFAFQADEQLERFAALVAAHEREKLLKDMLKDNPFLAEQLQAYIHIAIGAEREACAKVAESYEPRCEVCPRGVANAIQARSKI